MQVAFDFDVDAVLRPADPGDAEEPCKAGVAFSGSGWGEGVAHYFSGGAAVLQAFQNNPQGKDIHSTWVLSGARFVLDRPRCTHVVIDWIEEGIPERDRCAAEDVRWAEDNGVGEL